MQNGNMLRIWILDRKKFAEVLDCESFFYGVVWFGGVTSRSLNGGEWLLQLPAGPWYRFATSWHLAQLPLHMPSEAQAYYKVTTMTSPENYACLPLYGYGSRSCPNRMRRRSDDARRVVAGRFDRLAKLQTCLVSKIFGKSIL